MFGRSMEEVWKDISLSSIRQGVPSSTTLPFSFHTANPPTNTTGGVVLHSFLDEAYKEADPAAPPKACPPASLSPNSPQIFGYDLNADASSSNSGLSLFSNDQSECTTNCLPEQQQSIGRGVGGRNCIERRTKRMIKNRESASRSRARKQAYTNALELEAARLLNENEMLKRQCDELRVTMAAQNPTVSKRTLQRTLTAPF